MRISLAMVIVLFAILASTDKSTVHAFKEFNVGGRLGWRIPNANDTVMYNDWAGKKRFHIGDTLRFKYNNDSVLLVDKYSYYHCVTTNPISSYDDGNTTITLDNPGPIYFISGDSDHCKSGQRLIVNVMSPHNTTPSPSPSPSSSSIANPPATHYGDVAPALSKNSGTDLAAVGGAVWMKVMVGSVVMGFAVVGL